MSRDEGRLVLVTGAARGIGRAVAEAFGRHGARVVVNHPPGEQDSAELTADLVSAAGGTPIVVEADIGDAEAVAALDAAVAAHGVVDVLVNNAGICPFADFFEITPELWDRTHEVNLRGAFLLTQAVTKRMVRAGRTGGRVIAVSSISAFTGGAHQAHYCPTKAGLSAFMKSIAIALAPHQITCNTVQPGIIATDINRADLATPGRRGAIEARVPLGIGRPEDVAAAVVLLADPGARYITGADLVVDGGLTINPGT
ncbi:SDR family oxidoreductase [Nocardia panacis]|uniref:L-rhamnose 1-dehydrogenase (NAD(P)(+)) n=1 Tax=Nocardia panacis TaxID=2340916 RepID=A0A3A4K853_9NOCA|nr:SDR family oxidoreductase [Nocardia panacis]RJO73732.1 SDR family oxidoreductase [Nocardia panacis]